MSRIKKRPPLQKGLINLLGIFAWLGIIFCLYYVYTRWWAMRKKGEMELSSFSRGKSFPKGPFWNDVLPRGYTERIQVGCANTGTWQVITSSRRQFWRGDERIRLVPRGKMLAQSHPTPAYNVFNLVGRFYALQRGSFSGFRRCSELSNTRAIKGGDKCGIFLQM